MKLQPPYLRRLQKIGAINIWLVDGNFIRANLNEEFTNFGQHYCFSFIPKNEFWLDREHQPDEKRFFIHHLLTEHRLMSRGASYQTALAAADKAEKQIRRKNKLVRRLRKRINHSEDILNKIHQRLLPRYSNHQLKTWLVNGSLVRSLFFNDFTEGGHDYVYHFIPSKEIWLDNDLSLKERPFIVLHELVERYFMSKGLLYDQAHFNHASIIEYHSRSFPKELPVKIKKFISIQR